MDDSVQNDFVLHIIGEKDVRTPPLSIGKSRRSLAVAVVELLNLHPPLSISGADISLEFPIVIGSFLNSRNLFMEYVLKFNSLCNKTFFLF